MEYNNKEEKYKIAVPYISNRYPDEMQRAINDIMIMKKNINNKFLIVHRIVLDYVANNSKSEVLCGDFKGTIKELAKAGHMKKLSLKKGHKIALFKVKDRAYRIPEVGQLCIARHQPLQSIHEDFGTLCDLAGSIINGYIELSIAVVSLEEKEFAAGIAKHLEMQLESQTIRLNVLLGELNSLAFLLFDTSIYEENAMKDLLKEGRENYTIQRGAMNFYRLIMEKRTAINKLIEERQYAMAGILKSLRNDMAKVRLAELENEVAEKNKRLRQYKDEIMIQDIKDYEDLDGQYRHKYDEEGNLLETEVYEESGKNNGLIVILISTVIVIIVAYFMIKHYY